MTLNTTWPSMAHQTHNIAWSAATAHLKPIFPPAPPSKEPSNLYVRDKPNQARDLQYFVKTFAGNLREHTRCERAKYPATLDVPSRDDVLLSDAAVRRITPTVLRARLRACWSIVGSDYGYPHHDEYRNIMEKKPMRGRYTLCPHTEAPAAHVGRSDPSQRCTCILPFAERKVSAFLPKGEQRHMHPWLPGIDLHSFFNMEVAKSLIMHDQMEPLLRICRHPENELAAWQVPDRHPHHHHHDQEGLGWNEIYLSALDAYLALNLLYSFPQLWDPSRGRTPGRDYRSTFMYQKMLRNCAGCGDTSEIAKFPHRDFLGLDDVSIMRDSHFRRDDAGMLPFPLFQYQYISHSRPFPLSQADARYVFTLLQSMGGGLPAEIVEHILNLAEYRPNGRLRRPDNPLHADNWDELRKYLTYCWQLLVRCSMLAAELGDEIDWESLVTHRLGLLVSASGGGEIYDRDYAMDTFWFA